MAIPAESRLVATRLKPDLITQVDFSRLDASRRLDPGRRADLGQFLTPAATALLMASMFEPTAMPVRLLDAGAGVGSLSAAFVSALTQWSRSPGDVGVSAYEIDPTLFEYLKATMTSCGELCDRFGIRFSPELLEEDFIEASVASISGGFLSPARRSYNYAIVNPPYRKINSDSRTRGLLRRVGIETTNLYTGFLSLIIQLLEPGGQLVAITPRSFCNGSYFKPFRREFLKQMTVRRMHVFESRERAFSDDSVLQENVILYAVKEKSDAKILISSSSGPEDEMPMIREVRQEDFVRPNDPDLFMHIVPDELGRHVAERMSTFYSGLAELGIAVSTGRVVDFRAKDYLRLDHGADTAPLIYPGHFANGFVRWPKEGRKPNALVVSADTTGLLVPSGVYVLVKRFSAKEESRRVVAAVYDPLRLPSSPWVGFENHVNYYHQHGKGLSLSLAKGLCAFLNGSLTDSYFRHFNGHTQVNATDLRSLTYPTRKQLEALGSKIGDNYPTQSELDIILKQELFQMSENDSSPDPVVAKRKIDEALTILKALGFPRQQQNERSALTLLALLDLRPEMLWVEASDPLKGITQMMSFFSDHYGKTYAPNTRETVRRQTIHQFVAAGLAIPNPDKPSRPTNSGKTVYQIEANTLRLIQTCGTSEWESGLRKYLTLIETLKKRYAQDRAMERIPLVLNSKTKITLSPGGQNVLVEKILSEFCPRFTPGAKPIYVGDTDDKWAYFDSEQLKELGVTIEAHGKMPDVVIWHVEKNWLVLIEAVTSHGPVNPKRRDELQRLFKDSSAGLVFVTAFLDRKTMAKYLDDISWETEVWAAEYPDHLVHFNGERFLGPYEETPNEKPKIKPAR